VRGIRKALGGLHESHRPKIHPKCDALQSQIIGYQREIGKIENAIGETWIPPPPNGDEEEGEEAVGK
jgi:hypothetical protein